MSKEDLQDLGPEASVSAAGDPQAMRRAGDSPARHPKKAFVVLAFIEVWERFGYYGMTALMVLYMVEHLGLGDARADTIWGAFSALVYCMPMLGGYIGDRVLGARRTLVLGAIGLGLGYILLSIPMRETFFPAMGLLVLGNGLFKVNPNSLVSRLYEGDRSKLDILFTLYYVSLNIGSFVSILLAPWIKNHAGWMIVLGPLRFDSWHLAFGISAIGMTIALLDFGVFHRVLRPYGTIPDFKKLDLRKLFVVIGAGLVIAWLMSEIIRNHTVALAIVGLFLVLMIAVFAHLLITGEKRDRNRVIACIVFTLMSIVWAIYNQQIYTSLTLFALRNVQHHIGFLHVEPAQFQDLNQFWLVVLGLPLAWFYQCLGKTRRGDFSIATKYAVGLYMLAIAFFLYAGGGFLAQAGRVSGWWLFAGYGAQSLGELLISALGLSMVSQLIPVRSRGIIMGAWFLGMGVSLYAGGAIASLAAIPSGVSAPLVTLPVYRSLFLWLGFGALVCAIAATLIRPFLKRLMAEPDAATSR